MPPACRPDLRTARTARARRPAAHPDGGARPGRMRAAACEATARRSDWVRGTESAQQHLVDERLLFRRPWSTQCAEYSTAGRCIRKMHTRWVPFTNHKVRGVGALEAESCRPYWGFRCCQRHRGNKNDCSIAAADRHSFDFTKKNIPFASWREARTSDGAQLRQPRRMSAPPLSARPAFLHRTHATTGQPAPLRHVCPNRVYYANPLVGCSVLQPEADVHKWR